MSNLLSNLDITSALRSRIVTTIPPSNASNKSNGAVASKSKPAKQFVLYLPTVNLRMEQNPAFTLACHIANHAQLPLVVLATVLDDHHMPHQHAKPVVMTSRRLAFLLESLSEATKKWSDHGAAVAIRVHATKCRSPDNLTLCGRAFAVVTDEPFVNPFLTYVQRTEKVCHSHSIPCFRVDGSTTVPPASVLKRKYNDEKIFYTGVPSKAWIWQKQTEAMRQGQLQAAMNGEFDAPDLNIRVEDDDFFIEKLHLKSDIFESNCFPKTWKDFDMDAPGKRPWTVMELNNLYESGRIKEFAQKWHGADSTVKPCATVGTTTAGMERWNKFVRDRKGLVYYGRRRTDPLQPHASSRMSCYLNFGVVSIFQLVYETKLAQTNKVAGADKFEEEIVKWREMSYAHAFSRSDYDGVAVVPQWARKWLEEQNVAKSSNNYHSLEALESSRTDDDKWDAMQRYLVSTGELHNNVRMTWGKQIVHWLAKAHDVDTTEKTLQTLVYLNDRFALDGLSPPSYAGLLWCLGWCDKPDKSGRISSKPASRYKIDAESFEQAENVLLDGAENSKGSQQTSILSSFQKQGTKRKDSTTSPPKPQAQPVKSRKTIDMFFASKKF
ncbi:hypothetical protein CTEN210_16268 [Chaetoceros tenuissimus]|uniref:Photolyase/cryptochrome alpha/beta domain-containing protein n=1 Tax=Chaetoceros tenuissimus TaxID=426638 RepID=A0AAD3HDF0_9STRA|nr:hypothetical protein CTEN210_16268 [Chaetoceros tenuissimus]